MFYLKSVFLILSVYRMAYTFASDMDPVAYQEKKLQAQSAVVLVSSAFSKGVGFFIDKNTLVTSIDAVADKKNGVLFPTGSLKLFRGKGIRLPHAKVVGYRSFSLLLNLAVLKVQGYEGYVLPFEKDFGYLAGHGESYLLVFNKEGVLKTLTGQVMGGGSYHTNQYVSAMDIVRGGPVLTGSGSLQAVVFQRETGGQSVKAIPLSLLKDLIDTDFEWHTLKNIHQVFKKIRHKDQELLDRKASPHPGKKDYFTDLYARWFLGILRGEGMDPTGSFLIMASKDYAPPPTHKDFYILNSTDEGIAEKQRLINAILKENPSQESLSVLFYQLATMYYRVLFDRGYFKNVNHPAKDIKNSESWDSYRQKMIFYFEQAAQRGHVLSQYHLGQFYLKEYEAKKDLLNRQQKTNLIKTSVKWHKEAAEQGYASAQLALAVIHEDSEKARHWLEKAALQDLPQAVYRLGILYMKDALVMENKKSYTEVRGFVAEAALQWWARAANLGYGPAFFAIAELYRNGWGVEKNHEKAHVFYQAACTWGWTCFDKKIMTTLYPDRFQLEEKKVVDHLIFLALKGHTPASYTLAQLYHRGHFVVPSLEEARRWYRKVALKGDPEAQFDLAQTYRQHSSHSWSNVEEAKKWLTKAQAGGHPRAALDLEEIKAYEKNLKEEMLKQGYGAYNMFLFSSVSGACLNLFY